MHSCPDCGQACYCNGSIDDIEIESDADVCTHCLGREDEDENENEDEP